MDHPSFEIGDNDRYSRLQLIAWWDQQRLRRARVLVVGAGALGNEVLKNLALVGVGHVDIVDFDRIEHSNLSRGVLFRDRHAGLFKADVAADSLRQLNPDIRVTSLAGNVLTDVGLGRIRAADLVIGCLDNREARLWVNRMCWKVNRPWIDGGIQEINGVAKVFRPPDGACYECGMTDADYRLIQLRYSCPLLQQSDLQQGKVPTAPTIASIIGGLQVQEALKLLHGLPSAEGTALVFNGVANQFYQTRYPIRPDCMSHETYEPIEPLPQTNRVQAGDFLKAFAHDWGNNAELVLDRDWVTNLVCDRCRQTTPVGRPQPLVRHGEATCERCGQLRKPEMIHRVRMDGLWADRTLRELGIPDWDIVKIETKTGTRYYELSADGEGSAADK